jgi:hypothetical protein
MTDEPEFHFEVTGPEIEAAVARGDYEWLCTHVFIPATVQFLEKKHTAALLNNPRPRARRPVARHPRTRRSTGFRPPSR